MPASFISLPTEVLLLIIRNVENSGWLLNLALCCRSLYYLTLPCLYTDVKLLFSGFTTGFLSLKPFTTHMLKNPVLASHVRGIAIEEQSSRRIYPSSEPRLDETVRELISRSSISQMRQEKWIEALEGGDNGSFVALLLSSLPNIQRLSLVGLPWLYPVEELFKSAAKSESFLYTRPAFSSLRVLRFESMGYSWTSLSLLSSFLQLPSLREFYGEQIYIEQLYDDKANRSLAALKSATISLDHLEIREGSLSATELPNLLRASRSLKTIVYEVDLLSNCAYRTPEIREALTWNQNSLENLWLDLFDEYSPSSQDISPMSTLSSFTMLKNLCVGMHVFFGDEFHGWTYSPDLPSLMPASIETLYFSRTKCRVNKLTSALEKLLQAKESHTPKLRMIAFEADMTGDDSAFDYSRLDFLAQETGVEIARFDCTGKERRRETDSTSSVRSISDFIFFFDSIPDSCDDLEGQRHTSCSSHFHRCFFFLKRRTLTQNGLVVDMVQWAKRCSRLLRRLQGGNMTLVPMVTRKCLHWISDVDFGSQIGRF